MDVNEYFEDFMEELRSKAIANGSRKSHEFLDSSLERIVDYGDIDDYEIIEFNELQTNTKPINAYYFDDIFNQLTVVVNLFKDLPVESLSNLTNSEISPPYKRAVKFIQDCLERDARDLAAPNTDMYYFISHLKNSWPNIKEVKIIFLTNKPLSKRYAHQKQGVIDKRTIALGIWDLRRFHEAETSGNEREAIEIDLSGSPLPALLASASTQITSYLVVIPATKLASIYEEYKSRILEQNVRSFLQNRSNVNKGIRLTLEKAPDRFFAYNNGITATAQDAEFDGDGNVVKLNNLQIVNGGQTTAQVYHGKKAGFDLTKVSIQMKLNLIADHTLVDEIVPNIAKFANSQNAVSQADLFSNSPFHIKIEKFSREIIPPLIAGNAFPERWFYERSRGQYLNEQIDLSPAGKREFQRLHPKSKMITKTDLALVMNSWEEKPYQVSKGAQANFKIFAKSIEDIEKNPEQYNERYFRTLIAKTIVFKGFRKEIPRQDWYSGFPANITTYSIAWLAFCMRAQNLSLNVDKIWKDQLCDALLIALLLSIGDEINKYITSYSGNPTTFAKRESCWTELIESFPILELKEDNNLFISVEKAIQIEKTAETEQRELDALNKEVILFSIHPDCWLDIKEFSGPKISPSKDADIQKLRQGDMIPDFKVKPLAKLVREFEKAGGKIVYKDNLKPYSVS